MRFTDAERARMCEIYQRWLDQGYTNTVARSLLDLTRDGKKVDALLIMASLTPDGSLAGDIRYEKLCAALDKIDE